MRCDQVYGLPPSARKWIEENCEKNKVSCGHFTGMFGDEYPLFEYTHFSGSKIHEFVQSEEWYSGPMFYIGLKDAAGPVLLWKQCKKCFEFHDGEHDPELCLQLGSGGEQK
jgi:hypothetical protein